MSHGIRYAGAHVPAAKPPELCGHLPRRRAARHAVRPRPSCMCIFHPDAGIVPHLLPFRQGQLFQSAPWRKMFHVKHTKRPIYRKRDETDSSPLYAYPHKSRISHEKPFSGPRRSGAVLYTGPAAMRRFHGAVGRCCGGFAAAPLAERALAPAAPKGSAPPSVYREKRERRTAYKRCPKLSIYKKPPR